MLGERIIILRCQKGLTQAELAKLLHISTSALGMYEQGRRQPSLDASPLITNLWSFRRLFTDGKTTDFQ